MIYNAFYETLITEILVCIITEIQYPSLLNVLRGRGLGERWETYGEENV